MKIALLLALLLAVSAPLQAIDTKNAKANSRTVIHADGTRTESVRYADKNEQREVTFDAQGVKIASKVYLLNAEGNPVQGNLYDGRDQLQARAQFFFDAFKRPTEQRMTNLSGQVYQRIMFEYDSNGKPLPPKSYTMSNVQGPDLKPAVRDFTGMSTTSQALQAAAAQSVGKGSNIPTLPKDSSGGTAAQWQAQQQGSASGSGDTKDKKGTWLGRLFGGKKDTDKK
jgi:hypothetical protein